MKSIIYIGILGLMLMSCAKDDDFGPRYTLSSYAIDYSKSKIIIGCEGNFQYSNASVSVIQTDEWTLANDVYQSVNQSKIGDVLQSFKLKGDTLVVVLNNSSEVLLLNSKTLKEIDGYKGFLSPRYVEFLNDSTICVSDLYADYITVFKIPGLREAKTIATQGWTEQLIKSDSFLIAANIDRNSIQFIDFESLKIQTELFLGFEPNRIFMDTQNNLIAIGKDSSNSYHYSVLTENKEILNHQILEFDVASADVFNDHLFVCGNQSVFKIDYINNLKVKLFNHKAITPYGFKISPNGDYLIINDALDYASKGDAQFYSLNGELLRKFQVGFIPQAIEFAL